MRRLVPILLLALATAVPASGQPSYDAYDAYAALLDRYVDDGEIDYARWKAEDPPEWDRFLEWLAAADPSGWSIDERRAFWINAYNARTIEGVLERYPLGSVKDVGFLGGRIRGFFSREEHPVAGDERTLDEIEEILLAEPLHDPRVHFALVCASRGCPRLRPEPYLAERLDTQFDFQARTYLNRPAGSRLDRGADVLRLSRIFEWYRDDFARAAGSVRAYVARYLTGPARDAALDDDVAIEYLEYDWSLNDRR